MCPISKPCYAKSDRGVLNIAAPFHLTYRCTFASEWCQVQWLADGQGDIKRRSAAALPMSCRHQAGYTYRYPLPPSPSLVHPRNPGTGKPPTFWTLSGGRLIDLIPVRPTTLNPRVLCTITYCVPISIRDLYPPSCVYFLIMLFGLSSKYSFNICLNYIWNKKLRKHHIERFIMTRRALVDKKLSKHCVRFIAKSSRRGLLMKIVD